MAHISATPLIRITALASVFLLTGGCAAHRPALQTWRLIKRDTGDVMIPPGVGNGRVLRRTFRADAPAATGLCTSAKGVVEIRRARKRLVVTVFPKVIAKQPRGWLDSWSAAAEAEGCIGAGAAAGLTEQIAESVPLGINTAFGLLHSNDRQTGIVDLGAPLRLQVVSPIMKAGAESEEPIVTSDGGNSLTVTTSANLLGYETDWYVLRQRPDSAGSTIVPESADLHIGGVTERRAEPAENYLRFAPEAAFYRLFYKSGETGSTAIVLAAHTRLDLDRETQLLGNGFCDQIQPGLCTAIPRKVAINSFVPITVNGNAAAVSWGSTVSDAIRQAGERKPESVLAQLSIERRYKGRTVPVEFDRLDPAILSLVLTGGEVISWSPSRPQ